MAAIADDDLTDIFADWDSATYTPAGGDAATISGVFSRAYLEGDGADGPGIDDREPLFTARTTDLSAAAQGDALVVSGTTYTVTGVEHQGNGVTRLRLGT